MDELPLLSPRDSESYPRTKRHQLLKLLTHSYDFGRFDLATLVIEWFNYLLFTAFLAAWLQNLLPWDLSSVAIPLYIAICLGFLRSGFCGKRSRCAVASRTLFSIICTLLVLFVLLKAKHVVDWSWDAVLAPLYLLFSFMCISLFVGWLATVCLVGQDTLFKFELTALWICSALCIAYTYLLARKLDSYTLALPSSESWWIVSTPLWIVHAIFLISSLIFWFTFPDKAFIDDNVTRSRGSRIVVPSIKPRLRVNFFFLLASLLNVPVAIFNLMMCYFLETKESTSVAPYNEAVLFAPVFAAEIVGLLFAFSLMNARRQRGTYCVKIDNGPGVPTTEICCTYKS